MQHKNLGSAFSYMRRLLSKNKRLIGPQEYQHCTDVIERFWDWWHDEDSLSADALYLLLCEESDLDAKCYMIMRPTVKQKETKPYLICGNA